MSETEYLRKPYIRRLFYTLILLLIFALGMVRYVLLPLMCGAGCASIQPDIYSFLAKISEDILVSLLVTVGIASFFFWINPPSPKAPTMEAIEPRLISHVFETARQETDYWYYQGGTGTYLKAVTLPENARLARAQKKKRQITIEILDPTNRELCLAYSRYRLATAPRSKSENDAWTEERVVQELYATILMVGIYKKEEPALEITLGLSPKMSTFRYDMSSNVLIITNEDPKAPAIRVDRGTYYYDIYRDELRISLDQARKIAFQKPEGISKNQVNTENVVQLFNSLGIWNPILSEDTVKRIIKRASSRRNPYG